jgi:ATP-dependent RNA helicase TDRD9
MSLYFQSTQVPQYILNDCNRQNKACNILVSQPRKIAAITIAQRVSLERNTRVGEEIGYQVGLDKLANDSEDAVTSITYCTTGVILAKLIHRKTMSAFSHIILDEVHERCKY